MSYLDANLQTIDCSDLDEFWECISPIGKMFGNGLYVYRGQGDSSWQLTPRIFRASVIEKYRVGMKETVSNDHPGQTFIEYLLLRTFLIYCDKRGLAVPCDSMEFRAYLGRVMNLHGIQNHNWPDQQILPLMALAQHHGVPTRLLDVSSSSYVASYFAATSAFDQAIRSPDDRLAVFGLEQGNLSDNAGIRIVQVPGSTSPNLSAQSGAFVLVENSGYRGEEFIQELSIEAKLAKITPKPNIKNFADTSWQPFLIKVTLPIRFAADLHRRCEQFGVSAATIFPGYDGAARAANESYLAEALLGLRRS